MDIVQGSLQDLHVVETVASYAEIVISTSPCLFSAPRKKACANLRCVDCAPDVVHSAGIGAALSGLASSPASHKFYIHTSGAARVWTPPDGNAAGRIWDDVLDFDDLPPDATHGPTDKQVAAANTYTLHTAIVSPPFVVGRSPSRAHAVPTTFPDWMHVIRGLGGVFVVEAGENITGFADTESLAGLYLALLNDALDIIKGKKSVREEVWGPRAYYFVSDLEVSFREFNEKWLLPSLKRCGGDALVGDGQVKSVVVDKVVDLILGRLGSGLAANIRSRDIAEGFGTSMRIRGTRAKKFLGYHGVEGLPGLEDAVKLIF